VGTVSGVVCGTLDEGGQCEESVVRTAGPAGSLWCPVHGHVLDVLAPKPLTGTVILTFREGCVHYPINGLEGRWE
jgi:hypothetical protein